MQKINKVKHCTTSYRIINGKRYEQFSDCKTKEECQLEYPDKKFISRSIDNGSFVRIFIELEKERK